MSISEFAYFFSLSHKSNFLAKSVRAKVKNFRIKTKVYFLQKSFENQSKLLLVVINCLKCWSVGLVLRAFFKINGLLKISCFLCRSKPQSKNQSATNIFRKSHSAFALFGFNVLFYFLPLTPATRRITTQLASSLFSKLHIIFYVAIHFVNYYFFGWLRLVAVMC